MRRHAVTLSLLALLGAGTACQSYRMVADPVLAGAGNVVRADFTAPRTLLIVGPGAADSLRAADVARVEGRLHSVVGDTIRLRLDAAVNAAGHRFQIPRGAQVTILRGEAIYSTQRADSGRTAGLVVGGLVVGAVLSVILVAILVAEAFDGDY